MPDVQIPVEPVMTVWVDKDGTQRQCILYKCTATLTMQPQLTQISASGDVVNIVVSVKLGRCVEVRDHYVVAVPRNMIFSFEDIIPHESFDVLVDNNDDQTLRLVSISYANEDLALTTYQPEALPAS